MILGKNWVSYRDSTLSVVSSDLEQGILALRSCYTVVKNNFIDGEYRIYYILDFQLFELPFP